MSTEPRTCPSCGSHVSPEADRCELCGTPVDADDEPGDEPPVEGTQTGEETEAVETDRSESESGEGPSVFCNQCGWENPPGARYCSRCGEALQDLSDASPDGTRPVTADLPTGPTSAEPSDPGADSSSDDDDGSEDQETDEQLAIGRQIMLVVGGALVVVLGLFFVTQWSSQYEWGDGSSSEAPTAQAGGGGDATSAPSSGGQGPMSTPGQGGGQTELPDLQNILDQVADPLSGEVAGQIDSLEAQVEQASGVEKQQLQAKLVNLLIGAGQPGRAAVVQRDLAEANGTVEAQRRAADLLYRWMEKLQRQGDRKRVFQVARHAAQVYGAVAEQRPDDLDARTRMGEAYLLTNEPMRGIKAINAVLEDDSTFVPARFQKGFALLQINRLDQATRQFEMVKQFAEDGSPFFRQAEQALKAIEKQRTRASSGTDS